MITLNEREKEIIMKASLTLYTLSCRANETMEAWRLEQAGKTLEAILEDYE